MALNWQSLWEIRGREGLQDHVLQSARQILSGCCRGSQRRSLVQRRHLLGSRAVRWSCSSRSSRIPSHPRNDAGHLHLSASGRLCPPEGCDNCDPLATFCSRRGDLKAWLVFLTAKLAQGWQVPQISSWLLLTHSEGQGGGSIGKDTGHTSLRAWGQFLDATWKGAGVGMLP